eukprot:TRINITY_DN2024_c0_g1_i1.p1 TRINITY_DN2024_c0_g1~~TRINITY_DN2024_c0_g1_i1.p1  ORF type:complete len:327 (-),score=98.47 TRINITY_DN2024_c0_g1_i1:88-1068(-)
MEDATAINQTTAQSSTSNANTESASSGSSWWGFVDMVKKQSENIIKIYKEDLTEFGKTITHDTKEVIKKTADDEDVAKITSQITTGISSMLGINAEEKPSEQPQSKTNSNKQVIVDRRQARILALQGELSTYCTEPSDQQEFQAWKEQFKVSGHTDEISSLLASNEKIREIHAKLVPVAVSYTDFWERYYFKLHKLNHEEERRAALVKRATNNEQADEEYLSWDEDEEQTTLPEVQKADSSKEEVEEYLDKLDTSTSESLRTSQDETAPASESPAAAPKFVEEEPLVQIEEPKQTAAPKQENAVAAPTAKPTSTPQEEKEDWDAWE